VHLWLRSLGCWLLAGAGSVIYSALFCLLELHCPFTATNFLIFWSKNKQIELSRVYLSLIVSDTKLSTGTAASATAFIMTFARALTAKASDVYDTVKFLEPDKIYNKPAPEAYVSFLIGAVFSVLGIVLWVRRLKLIRAEIVGPLTGSLPLRIMLSALIDNDDPSYAIVKMAAQSFLFLGGLQLNYDAGLYALLGYFALESCGDSFGVLLALYEAHDLSDVIVTSKNVRRELNSKTMTLQPNNVYEDVGCDLNVVSMVFVTQSILIVFIVSVL
jgi:hypothetical protein